MYPTLFHIGSFEITSFGAMMALAAVVGIWLFQREAHWSGLSANVSDAGAIGVVGGLLGAKLLRVVTRLAATLKPHYAEALHAIDVEGTAVKTFAERARTTDVSIAPVDRPRGRLDVPRHDERKPPARRSALCVTEWATQRKASGGGGSRSRDRPPVSV